MAAEMIDPKPATAVRCTARAQVAQKLVFGARQTIPLARAQNRLGVRARATPRAPVLTYWARLRARDARRLVGSRL